MKILPLILPLILLLVPSLLGESVRLAWNPPVGVAPSQYAVLIYEAAVQGPCTNRNWSKATWENTNSTQTTAVVTRPPGCYEFTVSYHLNGQIQGCRSNFVIYQIKPGEVAGPAPPSTTPTPSNLRIP